MRHRIVYTRHDGGVSVCCPSQSAIDIMSTGGFWSDMPHGFADVQIERQMARGIDEWTATRYARAMVVGGRTEAEALAIIRDRDCARFGTAHELVDASEIFSDRWFRNAWRRSPNGGPIYVDMRKARSIQTAEIKRFAKAKEIDLRWPRWKAMIRNAESPERLKAVWPKVPI